MSTTEHSPLLPRTDDDLRPRVNRQPRWRKWALGGVVAVVALVIVLAFVLHGVPTPGNSTSTRRGQGSTEIPENVSEKELLHLVPPFETRSHPIPPKLIDRTRFPDAIPTNAFWTNMLVGDSHGLNVGAGEVTLSPYTVRSVPKRLEVSYGDTRRVVTNTSITEYFNVDVSFTAYSRAADPVKSPFLLGDGNSTSREVVHFDPLSVTVQYNFEDQSTKDASQHMQALLVRGSPFVTVEYTNVRPVVELNGTLISVNGDSVHETDEDVNGSVPAKQWTSASYELILNVYSASGQPAQQRWMLYFAEPRTLQLQFANEKDFRLYNLRGDLTTPTTVRLVDAQVYTGAARLAVVPEHEEATKFVAMLKDHADVYPVSASIDTSIDESVGSVSFCWQARAFDGHEPTKPLLMMANPHHMTTLSREQPSDRFEVLQAFGHRTLKSQMTVLRGNCWQMEEALPNVGFGAEVNITNPVHVEALKSSLPSDANYTPSALDPYFFGKEIARQARLVLIADTLGERNIQNELLDSLEKWIEPWLVGQNEDNFVYDESWGGLCSKNGLKGVFWMTDFGNGWYNDHHFHYGYFIYSLGVVAKYRSDFLKSHAPAILSIVRDIASPNADDKYFPMTRHFSWFDGHSFASGVYTLEGGKSQESVSEAINAYYGVYLLGQTMGFPKVERMGRLLSAMEMRAAQTYWQMPSSSSIYEPLYATNKMTGQVAATKVSYTTWFGPFAEHIHLINMIPFTPITADFVSQEYVQEEFPVLNKQAFERSENPIDKRWKGYAYLDLGIIDPETAWRKVTEELDFYDDGNSKTNSLFWIATRSQS